MLALWCKCHKVCTGRGDVGATFPRLFGRRPSNGHCWPRAARQGGLAKGAPPLAPAEDTCSRPISGSCNLNPLGGRKTAAGSGRPSSRSQAHDGSEIGRVCARASCRPKLNVANLANASSQLARPAGRPLLNPTSNSNKRRRLLCALVILARRASERLDPGAASLRRRPARAHD